MKQAKKKHAEKTPRKLEAIQQQIAAQLNADKENFEGSLFINGLFSEIQKHPDASLSLASICKHLLHSILTFNKPSTKYLMKS